MNNLDLIDITKIMVKRYTSFSVVSKNILMKMYVGFVNGKGEVVFLILE